MSEEGKLHKMYCAVDTTGGKRKYLEMYSGVLKMGRRE